MYFYGDGVEEDESKARQHLTIAYGLGSRNYAYLLGLIFLYGAFGVRKTLVLAEHYLEISCIELEQGATIIC